MMEETITFAAGPAKLPLEVLLDVQKEFRNCNGSGISIVETSHRSATYDAIHNQTISLFKELLNVPANYKVLFLHGGGRAAFSAVALNLMGKTGVADYMETGTWSSIAAQDAEIFGRVNRIFPKLEKGAKIPPQEEWKLSENASYFYYCANETVDGVELPFIPDIKNSPIVCDMSSNILTKEIDISKFGVILFCTQKNVGPSGVAVVIIREDLIGNKKLPCPPILDFSVISESNSLLNTPSTFAIYVCGKVLEHVKKQGGVGAMKKLCTMKSDILYNIIDDSSGFYVNEVARELRSRINVTFRIRGGEPMEKKFLELAKMQGMIELKGHRKVGGIRASLYNAITVEHVAKLAGFMRLFENEYSLMTTGDSKK